jgi:hypothetical protein
MSNKADFKLYSYCLRYDDGAAPNPYWGACTLAICKPAIRRTAEVGDWVVGHGHRTEARDLSAYALYAMRVDKKMTMKEYDEYCRTRNLGKLPEWTSADFRRKVGDCIYDYSKGNKPRLRDSVHSNNNRERDLGGEFVLWSEHFYYFGDAAVMLPTELRGLLHPQQNHKVRLNEPYRQEFVNWIESLGYQPGTILGEPVDKHLVMSAHAKCGVCSELHDQEDSDHDVVC